MKTAIVILNWNGKAYLEKFLPKLLESIALEQSEQEVLDNSHSEVIVADNGSSDGSIQMMEEKFPQVRTIRFDKNYGFTGGYNKALKEIEAQYYLLLNSDVEVTDGWLEPLEQWMDSHHLCGACAPKLLSYSERDKFEYAGAAGGYLDCYGYPLCRGRVMKMTEKDYGQYDEPADVLWASGACLMVRSELYHRLGGLDERFFAHMEEIDLCWRIQLEGYRVTIIPESKVYHVGGGSLPNNSPWKLELNFRNNLLMLSKNLAMTIALTDFNENFIEPEDCYKHKVNPSTIFASRAAERACNKAEKIIRRRMILDGLSALTYLCTFKWSYFKAVVKAHRQFKKLRKDTHPIQIYDHLLLKGKIASVEGIYPHWIIPRAMLRGEDIFLDIRREMM